MKLSVVIPVYNERYLIAELLRRVLASHPDGVDETEVIVVDDGSTDGTRQILRALAEACPGSLRCLEHPANRGKGAAVRTGIAAATGDVILFQDADLEYDPRDYGALLRPFLEDGADAVFGSRFLSRERRRVLNFRHTLGNSLLTFLSNCCTDLHLTDMETGYKAFRASLLHSIPLRSNDYRLEPEITAKVARRGARVFEVPISYLGRSYDEGKKIRLRDGWRTLGAILWYQFADDAWDGDEGVPGVLHHTWPARRLHGWLADLIAPHVGARVLELGAGLGHLTGRLLPRDRYVAADDHPRRVEYLRSLAPSRPYFDAVRLDLEADDGFAALAGRFDTVICMDGLEHVRQPIEALGRLLQVLAPGGTAVIHVAQGPWLYGTLDEAFGHRCRYERAVLREELATAGFELVELVDFNRLAALAWWLNGKVLRRRGFSRLQLRLFDWLVPLLRHVDRRLPWPGQGLIAIARKPS